jgi:hypothetical protein
MLWIRSGSIDFAHEPCLLEPDPDRSCLVLRECDAVDRAAEHTLRRRATARVKARGVLDDLSRDETLDVRWLREDGAAIRRPGHRASVPNEAWERAAEFGGTPGTEARRDAVSTVSSSQMSMRSLVTT